MNAASPELQQVPPQAVLSQMMEGFMVSQAVSVAAKLRLCDHLADGAKTAEELAEITKSHAPSLYRLMRALASRGIFRRDSENHFSNTPMAEFLRSDHPESMRAMFHMICDDEHWRSHGNLFHTVQTGQTAFEHTYGMPVFPYFAANPQVAQIFDEAMTSFSSSIAKAVAATYDFSGAETIADIGGGHGIMLSTILRANPNAKGILFDQPQVVAGADARLSEAGVEDRTDIVGGDFFAEIPVKADVYVMKHIIHDWNDEQSETILSNLAKSAPSGAKLLLVESVIEDDDSPSLSKVMDLNMLVMTGGRERTAGEYAELFEKTGFRFVAVHPTPSPMQIVEAVRV